MEHSQFSPSKLSRILACPASAFIEDTQKTNTAAEHGTLLHSAVVEACDIGVDHLSDYLSKEDIELVKQCLQYKNSIINAMGHNSYRTLQEVKVSMASWNIPEIYGTLDFCIWDITNRVVHIIDWKFGSGVIVYANNNPQLLAYAAGVVNQDTVVDTIHLHIFQPSVDHIDTFNLSKNKLADWVKQVRETIALCLSSEPPINPGEQQCRWCPIICKARHKQAQKDAKLIFAAVKNIPDKITNTQVANVLKVIPRLDKYIKQIRTYAVNELEAGRQIPGYKLVAGRSIRKWLDEMAAIKWCDINIPDLEIFETKFKSCSKLEKLDSSLKKNPNFGKLIIKPQGKATLAEESDKREAIQPSREAIDVFNEYKI